MPLESRIQQIVSLAHATDPAPWFERIKSVPDADLLQAMAECHSTGAAGARVDARRASLSAMLEDRRVQRLIESTEKLDAATTRLARTNNVLAAIGVVVAIIGVVVSVSSAA